MSELQSRAFKNRRAWVIVQIFFFVVEQKKDDILIVAVRLIKNHTHIH